MSIQTRLEKLESQAAAHGAADQSGDEWAWAGLQRMFEAANAQAAGIINELAAVVGTRSIREIILSGPRRFPANADAFNALCRGLGEFCVAERLEPPESICISVVGGVGQQPMVGAVKGGQRTERFFHVRQRTRDEVAAVAIALADPESRKRAAHLAERMAM